MVMKDSKLMKVLECCTNDDCGNCPTQVLHCKQHAMLNALDIIKRQKEEIERLREIISVTDETLKKCATLAKTEAIKEFADRLLALKIKPEFPWDDFFVTETAINDTLKEMTEEQR